MSEVTPCPHCPDGHTPPDGGSQPWAVWVFEPRDGQPLMLLVARTGGAHVAESDAEWMRDVLNGRARDPLRRAHVALAAQAAKDQAALEQAELYIKQQERNFRHLMNERTSYREGWKYEQKRRAEAEAIVSRVRRVMEDWEGSDIYYSNFSAAILRALDG